MGNKNKRSKSMLPTLSANHAAMVHNTVSSIIQRQYLAAYLGQSFSGDRNLYTSCGYPITLTYNDFYAHFIRGDIAKRIVSAYPSATWRQVPDVYENEDLQVRTEFERVWNELVKNKKVFHYLRRADTLSCIGQYSVLLLGFADGLPLDQELNEGSGKRLLYLRPYSQGNARIVELEKDTNNERYGLPLIYELTTVNPDSVANTNASSTSTVRAHWSRVVHVADGLLENDIYGTPALEAIYNRLQDIGFILGGSAEMHWKFGFPGMNFKADPEYDFDTQAKSDVESEVETYVSGLKRYMKLQGVDVQQLTPSGMDPTPLLTTELKFISGTTGIPIRILIGSERGELASTQDDKNWEDRVDERRTSMAEDVILRPFIDRLQYAGILPTIEEVFIDWPDISSPSELEKADVSLKRMQTLQAYQNAQGADMVYPPDVFLEREMGMTQEEIEEINSSIDQQMRQEEEMQKALEEQNKLLNPSPPLKE